MEPFCHLEGHAVRLRATSRPQMRFTFCLLARLSLAALDLIPLLAALRGLLWCGLLLPVWVLYLILVRNVQSLARECAYLYFGG